MSEESGKVFLDYTVDGPRIVDSSSPSVLDSASHRGASPSEATTTRCIRPTNCSIINDAFNEPASHYSQPWFYSQMTREEAQQYLEKYGIVDGVFLVRKSNRNPLAFVLSFVYNWRVYHIQILPIEDKSQTVLSLDCGRTQFYDLLQLVEFYQLNKGVLPTKLTHFLVHPKYHRDPD